MRPATDELVRCRPAHSFWGPMVRSTWIERKPAEEDEAPIELEVFYRVTHWGCPAQVSGPAENCYPAEPMEIDVLGAVGDFGVVELRPSEVEEVEDWVNQNPPEMDYGPED